jgi:signal transduction histidine kinase/ActR/RegA family two-component response regulator
MSTDPQTIRAEPHSKIGFVIQRDANILIERWIWRAVREQPNAARVHVQALLDHFREFLQALGRSLIETDETETNGHCLHATVHGEQRWDVGWSLPELVRDFQIFRLVILDHLEETLDRPLEHREVMAIGLALDEAITASVVMYVTSRDEHQRELEAKRTELEMQVQESLRHRANALQESDRRKNEFLATLAHELRNPLAPLGNAVAVLHCHSTRDETVLQIRDIFDRQVRQMARLLDDLLDVSRIAQGKVELQKKHVNLATVVSQAMQASEPLLNARQIQFEAELPAQAVWLEADADRLVQVVVNLLNNAAKYTDRGGRVWLTAEQEGDEAVVRVRDTGVGIAPELLPHIFDLFTQAVWPTEQSQGGLGIGLALVRRLVDLHGGAIRASSPGLGQGSEFVVRLPALTESSRDGDERPRNDDTPAVATQIHRRILVVDDNLDAAKSLAMLLQLQGHEVAVAHDGPTALKTADAFRPEVVFLDIGLPRMDGYQVVNQMRDQPWATRVLIIALTGYGQDEDRQRSAAAGFNAHLVKPVDHRALGQLLARAMHVAGST